MIGTLENMTKTDYIMFALGAITYAVANQIAGVIL